jgi:hypothetical protein
MKPLVDNPKEPIPLFRKNDAGEFVSLVDTQGRELFACGECRIIQQTYGTPSVFYFVPTLTVWLFATS